MSTKFFCNNVCIGIRYCRGLDKHPVVGFQWLVSPDQFWNTAGPVETENGEQFSPAVFSHLLSKYHQERSVNL